MGYHDDVPKEDGEAAVHLLGEGTKEKPRIVGMIKAFIAALSVMNLVLLLTLACFMRTYESCRLDQLNTAYCKPFQINVCQKVGNRFPAPVRSILRNQITVFDSGFDEGRTIYQGPRSEENDAAWDNLYNSKYRLLNDLHEN